MFYRTDYIILPMEEIVERYLNEEGIRKIAKDYGVSHETIRKRLIEEGIQLRSRGKILGTEDKKIPKKDMISLYKRGFTIKELAKLYETSYTLIYQRLKKSGVEINDPREIELPEQEMVDLYEKGWSQYQLAEKYNISVMTVNRRLKKLQVEARYKNSGQKRTR